MNRYLSDLCSRAHRLASQLIETQIPDEKTLKEIGLVLREIEVTIETYVFMINSIERLAERHNQVCQQLCEVRDLLRVKRKEGL